VTTSEGDCCFAAWGSFYRYIESNSDGHSHTADHGKDECDGDSAQWLTTVFMQVNGIMILLSAFLIARFQPGSFSCPP